MNYDNRRFTAIVDSIIDAYPPVHDTVRTSAEATDVEPVMIFIVGMPRSGTFLVEQIIDCHSQCKGAGVLEMIPDSSQNWLILRTVTDCHTQRV